jgi:hypothetical protein
MNVSGTADSAGIYHEWTSTCHGNEARQGRCTTCWEPAVSSGMPVERRRASETIQISVPGVVDVDELLSEPPPPWHNAYAGYTPTVKALVPVWKQRQIQKQQRARDGLK